MKKALITGVTGQDGFYLSNLLLEKSYEVFGIYRKSVIDVHDRVPDLNPRVKLIEGDLRDSTRLFSILKEFQPNEIYNLAAQSFIPNAWEQPELTCDINGMGVLRLLEAIRIVNPKIRLFQVSSREIFGISSESPQTENTKINPMNPYAAAKAFARAMIDSYIEKYGIYASEGIAFNHESPRRGKEFVTRTISISVARIKEGLQEFAELGNLDTKRDWGFAGDYVELMWLSLQQAKPDKYIIATGETHTIREFVEEAFEFVSMPIIWEGEGLNEVGKYNGKIVVKINPLFYRPGEADWLFGDIRKAREKLGWEPKTKFRELVQMMVKHDLEELQGNSI